LRCRCDRVQADLRTFFKPIEHISHSANKEWWDNLLAEFQPWWESETPRFGEADATGWNHGKRLFTSAIYNPPIDTTHGEWYGAETVSQSRQSLMDTQEPHAVVLFDDIRPFLVPIISPEARLQTVYTLLSYLGVQILAPDTSTNGGIDPFLVTDYHIEWPTKTGTHPWVQTAIRPNYNTFQHWAFDIDTLFSDPKEWFSCASNVPTLVQLVSTIPR
jgi:hypothetical protein